MAERGKINASGLILMEAPPFWSCSLQLPSRLVCGMGYGVCGMWNVECGRHVLNHDVSEKNRVNDSALMIQTVLDGRGGDRSS